MSETGIGLVCEGPTDFPILEAALQTILHGRNLRFFHLHPELDELSQKCAPAGWDRARAWCEQNRDRLEMFLELEPRIEILVLQVDQDRAKDILGKRPKPATPKSVGEKLRKHVLSVWLKKKKVPFCSFVAATPAQATETWIVAAYDEVDSDYEKEKQYLRDLENVIREYINSGRIKDLQTYSQLSTAIPSKWSRIRNLLSQAQVFSIQIEACIKNRD